MSDAEKRMFVFLIRVGGVEPCKKCVNCANDEDAEKVAEYGCPYAADGGCIEGMTEYFNQHTEE